MLSSEGYAMLAVTDTISIPLAELEWSYVRASGPGGQNVNKVASKAVLRWNVSATLSLPDAVKERLQRQLASRLTTTGDLIVTSQRYRDQDKNRTDCLDKLAALVHAATIVPKTRTATKPSKSSQRRRVADKRARATGRANRSVSHEE
jgi:ribosome-associated protein